MRIAVLSNVTIDMVTENLKKKYEVYSPFGYNTWQIEAADRASGLYAFEPEAVFVILYADRYEDVWQTVEHGKNQQNEWIESISVLSKRLPSVSVFVSDLDLGAIPCSPASEDGILEELDALWAREIREINNAFVLPVGEIVKNIGRKEFYSRKIWYMANYPYSLSGTKAVSNLIERYCEYITKPKKKCLVVDLDNTLWGGTIGEDGLTGIELSDHKEGARFYDAQKCLKRMKENGVMLAIASKNNVEDVIPVFEHPYMYLKEGDFVSIKINWKAKSENIREMAEELNIGLDSFVFLDDNPNEREQMKAACPEVTVLDFLKDTSLLPSVLEEAYGLYFKPLKTTDEDRSKTESYRQSIKRKQVQSGFRNLDEYLCNLGIVVDIHLMKLDELPRVIQLAGKTNQFNTTTIRYSEKEILDMSQRSDSDVVVACMEDRFGNEGLTSIVTLKYDGKTMMIEDFVMSCRVMGRKFENVIIGSLINWIRNEMPEITTVCAEYIKTTKNRPVENLFEGFGFKKESEEGNNKDIGYRKIYTAKIEEINATEVAYKEIIGIGEMQC